MKYEIRFKMVFEIKLGMYIEICIINQRFLKFVIVIIYKK